MDKKSENQSRKVIEPMIIDDIPSNAKSVKSNLCCSQRLIISILLGLCSFTFYAQRQSLNMGILCMIDDKGLHKINNATNNLHNHTHSCKPPSNLNFNEEEDDITNGPFLWDSEKKANILGSFYYGYVFQIFGGAIVSTMGPRNVLAISILLSSVTTFLIPFAASLHYLLVIVLRIIQGIAQGFMYPSCLPLISKWAPVEERGKLTCFLAAGTSLGVIVATAITGPICVSGLWQLNFFALASLGIIWLILWFIFGANTPEESRHISINELSYIQATAEKSSDEKIKSILKWPIKSMLTSRSVWIIIITNVLSDFTLYGIFSVFPSFLLEIYYVSVKDNSLITSGEYVLMWFSCVAAGILSDLFIQKKLLSPLNTRKLFNSIGMIIPAILFPIIGYMSCNDYPIVVALLVLCGGLQGTFINAGYLSNAVDVAGSYSGIIVSISNSLGSFSGILSPIVANKLTANRTSLEWRTCFYVFSSVLLLGGLAFLFFSKGELEDWAKDDKSIDIKVEKKKQKNNSQKLTRQYSLDSRGGLVPSASNDEYDSYNQVVYTKPSKHVKDSNVQSF